MIHSIFFSFCSANFNLFSVGSPVAKQKTTFECLQFTFMCRLLLFLTDWFLVAGRCCFADASDNRALFFYYSNVCVFFFEGRVRIFSEASYPVCIHCSVCGRTPSLLSYAFDRVVFCSLHSHQFVLLFLHHRHGHISSSKSIKQVECWIWETK